jgi:hypothetical protein
LDQVVVVEKVCGELDAALFFFSFSGKHFLARAEQRSARNKGEQL